MLENLHNKKDYSFDYDTDDKFPETLLTINKNNNNNNNNKKYLD